MEFVLFDGGFGKEYAQDAVKIYEKNFPKAKVEVLATQKIQSTLQPPLQPGQPRRTSINNSGAEQMDIGVLVGKKQLADLTPLLDAPSYDDPNKKVRDTLRPGIVRDGPASTATRSGSCYYAYTVYGVWYSQKAPGVASTRSTPRPGTRCSRCARRPRRRASRGWTLRGQVPVLHALLLYPMIGKVGGREVLDAIDNLEPNAWKHDGGQGVFEAYYELVQEGLRPQGHAGPDHIQCRPRGPRARRCSSRTAPGWRTSPANVIPEGLQPRRLRAHRHRLAPTSCPSARI